MRLIDVLALVYLVVLAVVLGELPASAQTVNNPSAVSFSASADHNVIWTPAPGQPGVAGPVLTNYLLVIQENGAAVRETDLGKPTPSATNGLSTPLTMTGGLLQGHTYSAVVVAVGPGGSAQSAPAGPFGWFVATPLPIPAAPTNVTIAVAQGATTGITVGGRVKAGSQGVLVRVAPLSTAAYDPTVQPPGALGTALSGPVAGDVAGWTWWQVDWDTGADGWCTEGPTFLTVP